MSDAFGRLDPPHEALARLLEAVGPVGDQAVDLGQASGRVLARAVTTDRPSPPADVSAMDGYAARLADLVPGRRLSVSAEAIIGQLPPPLTPGAVVRIGTGGCLPPGAEAVIRREHVEESGNVVVLPGGSSDARPGANIRRCGENAPAGATVLASGGVIRPGAAAALAAFGVARPRVFRRVRVGVLVTGDELRSTVDPVRSWQIRDSNGPALAAALSVLPWVEPLPPRRVADDPNATRHALARALSEADVVLTTGGVSMGDHDHVAEALRSIGGRVVYHGLAMRPGKPNLGGLSVEGKAVLGLPGNPVAVLCGLTRLVMPVLRRVGGFTQPLPSQPLIEVGNADRRTLKLWWYRPVRLRDSGSAELLEHRGSGDIAAAAAIEGFVEVAPDSIGQHAPWWPLPSPG